jgi:hypothetical protein
MDTNTLQHMLQLAKCSSETKVLACNELPPISTIANGTAFIVNLEENWKPGNHWIVLFCASETEIELFDSIVSNAEERNTYIETFVNQYPWMLINKGARLQDSVSESCGLFCLYFLYYRCKEHLSMETIIEHLFSDNTTYNECNVLQFSNALFDKTLFEHIRHACIT